MPHLPEPTSPSVPTSVNIWQEELAILLRYASILLVVGINKIKEKK